MTGIRCKKMQDEYRYPTRIMQMDMDKHLRWDDCIVGSGSLMHPLATKQQTIRSVKTISNTTCYTSEHLYFGWNSVVRQHNTKFIRLNSITHTSQTKENTSCVIFAGIVGTRYCRAETLYYAL